LINKLRKIPGNFPEKISGNLLPEISGYFPREISRATAPNWNGFQSAAAVDGSMVDRRFTLALVRGDYANLYHTTAEWYNAFLLTQFFGVAQQPVRILLVDAHPAGPLDHAWNVLFTGLTSLLPPSCE